MTLIIRSAPETNLELNSLVFQPQQLPCFFQFSFVLTSTPGQIKLSLLYAVTDFHLPSLVGLTRWQILSFHSPVRPLPSAALNSDGICWVHQIQGMLIHLKILSFESNEHSVPGIKDCCDGKPLGVYEGVGTTVISTAPFADSTQLFPSSLFLVHLLPVTISLFCWVYSHRPESLAVELMHRARVRHTAASTQSKPIPDRDPPEKSLTFGDLYQAWWKPGDIPHICNDAFLLQIHLEETEQCFTAELWRGRYTGSRHTSKCKPLTPLSKSPTLYTLISLGLYFLIFHNVSWLVWIWIIIDIFYSSKLRFLGPRNKYIWTAGMQ